MSKETLGPEDVSLVRVELCVPAPVDFFLLAPVDFMLKNY